MSVVHYQNMKRRGNALILVVGILVLLVLVATAFITKTQSGRATAIAQRDSSQISDRVNTINRVIADEIAIALFPRALAPTFEAPGNTANARRIAPLMNTPRYGHDEKYPFNYAPYAVIPWTNPPDPNNNTPNGIPLLGPNNPIGGPSFGDSRWLRDTEPQRADVFDSVGQGIPSWTNSDGTPETFTHWRHLTNLSRSGNALRVVRDISNVTGLGQLQGPSWVPPVITNLEIPIEQWPATRPQRSDGWLGLGLNGLTGYTSLVDGAESNFDLWEQWTATNLSGWGAAQLNPSLLPQNFLDLSDLDGDGIHNDPDKGERPLDAFIKGKERWHTERWITDTDGDGFTDALWHLLPQTLGPDMKQVIAVSITDNSALGNMNVATSFARKDYYGSDSARDRHGEATRGHTPADLAIIGQNDFSFGNVYPWRVGFMDNLANLPGHSSIPDGQEWISYQQIGPSGYSISVDWNTNQWRDRSNASMLDELGVEVDGSDSINPIFIDTLNMLNPTDDINSRYGRLWYWQLAGRDPFSATNGLRPFTISDELELRIAQGNNYQFIGSRFERSVNDIIGQVDEGEVINQFLRSGYLHSHEASEYRDQLKNQQLVFDNRRKLTMFSGSRNDLLPPWLRWEDRFWSRHNPESFADFPMGYNAFDIQKHFESGIPSDGILGIFGSTFPLKVAIEGLNAYISSGLSLEALEHVIQSWREQSRTKLDLREYYADSFFGNRWWESNDDGRLTFAERLPLQLLLAMTDSQEQGVSNLTTGTLILDYPANTPLGTHTEPNPDDVWSSIGTNYYQQARLAAAGLASNMLTYRDQDDGWRQHSTLPFMYNATEWLSTLPLSQAVTPPIIGRQSNDAPFPDGFGGEIYAPFADAHVAGPNAPTVELLGLEAQPFITEVFLAHSHQAKDGGDHWACCLQTGGCVDVSKDTCEALLGGTFYATDICDPVSGFPCGDQSACCIPTGGCIYTTQNDCDALFGEFRDGFSCEDLPCRGACCVDGTDQLSVEGECIDVTASSCSELGAFFAGFGTKCISIECSPIGSCCFESSTCMDSLNSFQCNSMGGTFNTGVFCAVDPCPPGACCLSLDYGACVEVTQETCVGKLGGTYMGLGTLCFSNPCVTIGACCFASGSCVDVMTPGACLADGGTYTPGTSCVDGSTLTSLSVPVADSWIDESNPTTNYGASTEFVIGEFSGANRAHIVLEYEIDPVIQSGDITSAVIVLDYEQFSGAPSEVRLARLTQSWDSSTVNWNTFDGANPWPNGAGAAGDTDESLGILTFSVGTSGDVKINVEDLVQDAIDNQDLVLRLLIYKPTPEGAVSNTQFASADTTTGATPTLTILYEIGVSPCAGACCLSLDVCEDISQDSCEDLGGTYISGTTCTAGACLGACCFSTGGCETLSQETCETYFSASYLGPGTSCDVNACGIEGACCLQYTPDEIWLNELLYDNSPVWINEFQYDTVDVAWLNELHYDNIDEDVNEFVEVAIDMYVDPNTVQVLLYDGVDGTLYNTLNVSAFDVGELQNGKQLYSLVLPVNGLQNGPDGVAIVVGGVVEQFVSYEGVFVATNGAANGLTSIDYGVSENNSGVGSSIGKQGTGSNYSDFTSTAFATASIGNVNEAQQINENELIEIALDSEIDPTVSSIQLLLYDGTTGSLYATLDASTFFVGNSQADMTLYTVLTTLQNGNDGIAIALDGAVKQFMSYEGSFTAADGAAAGLTSIDIPVTQNNASALASIGLSGSAAEYADFTWNSFTSRTVGAMNTGQTIVAYDEFIEVAIADSVNISDVSIELYSSTGFVYATVIGSQLTLGETQGGMRIYSKDWQEDFLENGPAAIAIIRDGEVVGKGIDRQFLSYEGVIEAADGVAMGMTSALIPIPLNNAVVGTSLGLIGSGSYYGDYSWTEFATNSMGFVNDGEAIILLEESEVCIEVSEIACELLEGEFQGKGILCGSVPCGSEIIRGSCCFDTGECEDINAATCHELEGNYQGDTISCIDAPCIPEGACCLESTSCLDLDLLSCEGLGGSFVVGEQCSTSPCSGTCCLIDGACIDGLTLMQCEDFNDGIYRVGQTCSSAPCIGACCIGIDTCDELSEITCERIFGGTFEGFGITCSSDPCSFGVEGACCIATGDACADILEAQCITIGGIFSGDGSSCLVVGCLNTNIAGACCLSDGTCIDVTTSAICSSLGGTYQGDNTSCATSPCTGACCLLSGSCTDVTQDECDTILGTFMGYGTACSSTPCRSACCLESGSCIDIIMQPTCEYYGGFYVGYGSTCATAPCEGACCTDPVGCEVVSALSCASMGGVFNGIGTSCTGETCVEGACCLDSGTCLETTLSSCNNFGGTFMVGVTCVSDPCLGACCLWAGGCELLSIDTCNSLWDPDGSFTWQEDDQPGYWGGFGSLCGPAACTPTGACCLKSGSCVDITDVPNAETDPLGFVYYCEEVLEGRYSPGASCDPTSPNYVDCKSACCLPTGQCNNLTETTCLLRDGDYQGGFLCADSPCNLAACCFDSGSCLELTQDSCENFYGGIWNVGIECDPDGIPNSGDEPCIRYFIVNDDTSECPQETIAVVQLANPFDREIDLNNYSVELFGQDFKLAGLNLLLPPATEQSPSTVIFYSMPTNSTIEDPLLVHDFNTDWLDFLDIEFEDRPDGSLFVAVPNVNWSTSRTYYDGLVVGGQNSVAVYKFDGNDSDGDGILDEYVQRVLIDRLDPPESRYMFDKRIVEELDTQWQKVGADGYIAITDRNGDRIEAIPNTSALLVQWDRATRAWGTDIPDSVRFGQTGWQNEQIDSWERNPRYVFAGRDFIRSEEIRKVTTPINSPPTEDIFYTSAFKWTDTADPLDPDDLDGDLNPDSGDDDLLPDDPDPWFTVEVWSPRGGTLRDEFSSVEGAVRGGMRTRKPTYFDMNHREDPLFFDIGLPKDQPWSFPDKGWYGQREDRDVDQSTSDTPAFEDFSLDGFIQIGEIDMSMAFPMQMLQKDGDFEQVGEVLNCWLFGHLLEGTHNQVDIDSHLVLPLSPIGSGVGSIDAGTITTFSEFMYPRWDVVEDWWAPWVAKIEGGEVVLTEGVNRLRYLPEGDTATPLMMGGRSELDQFLFPIARNYPWPRLSIASRVIDSLVCDGPGRPDYTGDGIGDDLNPLGTGYALPSVHSFYNANGFTGKITPGIININTAPVEVLRMLPHMYKVVHETSSNDSSILDAVDRNPRSLIPEAIVQWRENSNGSPNVLIGTGYTGGPDYFYRSTAVGMTYGLGPKHTRGFSSPSEIGLLQSFGVVDDVIEPWHIENNHQAIRDAASWSIDFAQLEPFGNHDSVNPLDYSIATIVNSEVGAPISTEVIHNTYFGEDSIIGDGVSGDIEEANILQSGISNLISTTSDMFTVHMRIRTFKRNPITGIWDATDLDYIVDDSRYVMLVDRSNVESPADKPRILYFEKLPN